MTCGFLRWRRTASAPCRFARLVYGLITFLTIAILGAVSVSAEPTAVSRLRTGLHDFGARIVLDLSSESEHQIKTLDGGRRIEIHLPNIQWDMVEERSLSNVWPLQRYTYRLAGRSGGIVTLHADTPLQVLRSFPLTPSENWGYRLVFDVGEAPDVPQSAGVPERVGSVAEARPRAPLSTEPSLGALPTSPEPRVPEPPTPEPRDLIEGLPPMATEPLVPPVAAPESREDAEPRIVLRRARVDGATVVGVADLRAIYEASIGRSVTLRDLKAMAERMTALYRNDGYVLSKVIVPEQEVAGGEIRFQAIEGYIHEVVLEGVQDGRTDLWRHWIDRIKRERPIRTAVLERYTLLANDLAGTTVKSVLRPAPGVPGGSELVLKATHKWVDASGSVENRGSSTTGRIEGTAVVSANSLLGLGEKTTLTYHASTERSQSEYIAGQISGMVSGEGTQVSFSGAFSRSAPGDILKDLELTSETITFGVSASHPLIKRRNENLSVFGGLTFTNAESDALSSRLYEDRLRVLNVGGSYDFKDGLQGENALSLQTHQGFETLGASEAETDLRSRSNGQTDFTKLTASASRLQTLPYGLSLSATFTGQWASAPLLASEEFSFGGSSYGRAYDSSEITGDHGMALALEMQYTTKPKVPHLKYLQPYVFWDLGSTWDIDADDDSARRSGSSAGAGLRFGLTDYFSGSLELSKPLTRPVSSVDEEERNDPRFFFNLSAQY